MPKPLAMHRHRRESWSAYSGCSVLVHVCIEDWHSITLRYASDDMPREEGKNSVRNNWSSPWLIVINPF
jgi:hypothetical protein